MRSVFICARSIHRRAVFIGKKNGDLPRLVVVEDPDRLRRRGRRDHELLVVRGHELVNLCMAHSCGLYRYGLYSCDLVLQLELVKLQTVSDSP